MGNTETRRVEPTQQLSENGVVNSNFIVQEPKTLMATDEKVVLYVILIILVARVLVDAMVQFKKSVKRNALNRRVAAPRIQV